MNVRVLGSLKLLVLLIAAGCEPSDAAPAPLSEQEAEDLPEVDEKKDAEQETSAEASAPRPPRDASVILTRDAGRDAAVDAGEPLDGSVEGEDADISSNPGADAGARDAATNPDGTVVPREAGAPIVMRPAATGYPQVDSVVDAIIDRCRNLSPDKVYLRARIENTNLGAIYDFEALDEPCQTETDVRPVIAARGTVLIANVDDANIGLATSGIHVPYPSSNINPVWSYDWLGTSNGGHQLRLPLTSQLCSSPRVFAVPDTSRFFVECAGGRIYDEEGQHFQIGGPILAVGQEGRILAYIPGAPQPAVAYYTRGARTHTFPIEPLDVKAARASGSGFLFVLTSNILVGSPVPDRLYFLDSNAIRTERGVYADLDATYRSYVGSGGTVDAALDANGVLYDMRSRSFTSSVRGIVVKRVPGMYGVTVYEDPLTPDDGDLMPYALHGLVSGP